MSDFHPLEVVGHGTETKLYSVVIQIWGGVSHLVPELGSDCGTSEDET